MIDTVLCDTIRHALLYSILFLHDVAVVLGHSEEGLSEFTVHRNQLARKPRLLLTQSVVELAMCGSEYGRGVAKGMYVCYYPA